MSKDALVESVKIVVVTLDGETHELVFAPEAHKNIRCTFTHDLPAKIERPTPGDVTVHYEGEEKLSLEVVAYLLPKK